jgi:hypothetical protein
MSRQNVPITRTLMKAASAFMSEKWVCKVSPPFDRGHGATFCADIFTLSRIDHGVSREMYASRVRRRTMRN